MMRKWLCIALMLTLTLMVFTAKPVAANRTTIYDTIAEWDAGTKSPALGGGDTLSLQTVTDNPSVGFGDHSNMLQSASVFGDHFRYGSGDANTSFWNGPLDPGCVDNGTQPVISNVDQIGVDARDGSMQFRHTNVSQTTVRSSDAPLTGVSDFLWEAQFQFSDDWDATTNFTWVAASPSSQTFDIWCGGLTTTNASYGGGWYFRGLSNATLIVNAQAFIYGWNGTANVFRACSPLIEVDLEPFAIMRRKGGIWSFSLYDVGGWSCAPVTGTQLPLYGVFDFIGASVAMIDYHFVRYWTHGDFLSAPTRQTYLASGGNWTSPATSTSGTERIIRVAITMQAEYPQVGYGITNISLVSSLDWTQLYQQADWTTICSASVSPLVCIYEVNGTMADGPYRVRIFPITNSVSAVWIVSVNVLQTGVIPPPVPGEGPPPPAILTPITGGIVFCGVGVGIFVVFIILLRRVKNEGGGA